MADSRTWRAPGRVNIIGEHIDYLGGVVLPFASDLELEIEVVPHAGEVLLTSADLAGEARVPIDGSAEPPDGWGRHVWGVVHTLLDEGVGVQGVRGRIRSDIPVGAGLSSSAALEVAIALAVTDGRIPDPEMLARAEQAATGVPCGVMDQTTVLNAKAGHALLLDCATRRFDHVPIHRGVGFFIVDTGTRRELADGRYAERRAEVEQAFAATGAGSLNELDESVPNPRLRHAVTENARVLGAVEALRSGHVDSLGALVSRSHASLRDDFGVSSYELDLAVEVAEEHERCAGARLVGAGFAGCIVGIAHGGAAAEDVAAHVVERLRSRLPDVRAYEVGAVDAAGRGEPGATRA